MFTLVSTILFAWVALIGDANGALNKFYKALFATLTIWGFALQWTDIVGFVSQIN